MKSEQILRFMEEVHFDGALPDGIRIMNPFAESASVRRLCTQFYNKYYADDAPRSLILGINPGRLGAGATGIPFTDTKRLESECGIPAAGLTTHEPSSVYIYDMIRAFGGPALFYRHFYINSVCPLGFIKEKGQSFVNYNYYDQPELERCVRSFIIENIRSQILIAGRSDVCFCLGTGKNFQYLQKLNAAHQLFHQVVPLEHPRYIMQYKLRDKEKYIRDYLQKLGTVL